MPGYDDHQSPPLIGAAVDRRPSPRCTSEWPRENASVAGVKNGSKTRVGKRMNGDLMVISWC